jgi:hypothetical protein
VEVAESLTVTRVDPLPTESAELAEALAGSSDAAEYRLALSVTDDIDAAKADGARSDGVGGVAGAAVAVNHALAGLFPLGALNYLLMAGTSVDPHQRYVVLQRVNVEASADDFQDFKPLDARVRQAFTADARVDRLVLSAENGGK